ncbi:MAG: M23 family metallopeptidase [Treponema sp.]|jgi:murein DD-endopeptidase MepM/ murein hydrolase activator NlpD|nr:M23 family metallopeptidase [Treponema sp.]
MIDALTVQHVRRRRPPSSSPRVTGGGFAGKTGGAGLFGDTLGFSGSKTKFHWKASPNLIDQIPQNPAHKRRRVKSKKPRVRPASKAETRPQETPPHREAPAARMPQEEFAPWPDFVPAAERKSALPLEGTELVQKAAAAPWIEREADFLPIIEPDEEAAAPGEAEFIGAEFRPDEKPRQRFRWFTFILNFKPPHITLPRFTLPNIRLGKYFKRAFAWLGGYFFGRFPMEGRVRPAVFSFHHAGRGLKWSWYYIAPPLILAGLSLASFPAFRRTVQETGFSMPRIALFSGLAAGRYSSGLSSGLPALEIEPPEDTHVRSNLAAYAGLNPGAPVLRTGETIPLNLIERFAWEPYTVKKGDSVSKIAAAHALSMDSIISFNGITNARRLAEGETLRLPNMDGISYTVERGDSLSRISSRMGVPLEAILDANDIESETITAGTALFIPGARMRQEDLKMALGEMFIYPVRGRLTSTFGWRNDPISGVWKHHGALDLAAAAGTPVKAAMDGRVAKAGVNPVYGKFIILTHGQGFQTMYAHLNTISVKEGAFTGQGNKIGEVGSTGYSTGPHLHFAVFKNGRAVNPLELLTP